MLPTKIAKALPHTLIACVLALGVWATLSQQDYCSSTQHAEPTPATNPIKDIPQDGQHSAVDIPKEKMISSGHHSTINVLTPLVQQEISYHSAMPSQKDKREWTKSFVCEAKATDVALAWFTFLLFVVTGYLIWMGYRQEQVLKMHERAYLVCGGMFGVPKPLVSVGSAQLEYRPKSSYFEGPWRMVIRNYGRTPGFIRKIEWGVCPKDRFIEDKSISEILGKNLLAEWMKKSADIQEVFPPTGMHELTHRYVECDKREINTVFFGRISYDDIFHEPHHSTWAVWHRKDHSDTLGSSFADDWS